MTFSLWQLQLGKMIRAWFPQLSIIFCCLLPNYLLAGTNQTDSQVAVIYPETRKPYRFFYEEVIAGVKESLGENITPIRLSKKGGGRGSSELENWIDEQCDPLIIALGHQAMSTSKELKAKISLIISSVISDPSDVPDNGIIVNYTPSPVQLFGRLKWMAPQYKVVYAVINPETNRWLIEYAKVAAAQHELKLRLVYATSLKESGLQYKKILSEIDPQFEAIWLPQDNVTINNQTIIPYLLNKAWKRKIVIFSSTLNHVEKGVLFSLYPDNKAVGKRLGDLAVSMAADEYFGPKFLLLDELKFAVNQRTARHLRMRLDKKQKREIDMLFPKL